MATTNFTDTKIDFYQKYKDDYKSFYDNEVNPACSKEPANLQEKISNIKNGLNSMYLDWDDPVAKKFKEYIAFCVSFLEKVEDSINSVFIESALDTYKELKDLIENLEKQNVAYRNRWDMNPEYTKDRYCYTESVTDSLGNVDQKRLFNQEAFDHAVDLWEDDVNELAGKCIETITDIESKRTDLNGINNLPIEGLDKILNYSTTIPSFDLNYDDSTETDVITGPTGAYTTGTFDYKAKTYTKWGSTFYVLANIKGCRRQEDNECLSYARANAIAITERNGNKIPIFEGNKKNGCVYTSSNPDEIYKIAADEFRAGRSVVLEVKGSVQDNTRHFVAVAGFETDTDFNNVKPQNILVLDSTSGGYKQLGTKNGGQRRDLTSDKDMASPHEYGTEYTAIVYSDVNYAQRYDGVEVAPKNAYGASQSNKGDGAINFAEA